MNRIQKSSFKISWNNNFDILNQKYALKNQHNGLNDELKIIRKANILVRILKSKIFKLNISIKLLKYSKVRRDALKKLYNADYAMYERELNAKGFTIHRERL